MATDAINPDDLIQAFLRAAKRQGTAILLVYAMNEDGHPVMRVTSNSDERGTAGILSWLQRTDDRAIEAAAEALYKVFNLDDDCPWASLDGVAKLSMRVAAREAIRAAKEQSGRTLNIQAQPLV